MNKAFGSCSSKLVGEMLPLRFGFWPKHVACFMEFIFFHISLLKSLNLVLIPGAKLDAWMLTHLDRVSIKIL